MSLRVQDDASVRGVESEEPAMTPPEPPVRSQFGALNFLHLKS